MKPTKTLRKALAVTCEKTQTHWSPAAIRVLLQDFSEFPEGHVIGALTRCQRELPGPLYATDIFDRIGHWAH